MDEGSQRMAKRERKDTNRGKQSPYSSKHVRLQQAVVDKKDARASAVPATRK